MNKAQSVEAIANKAGLQGSSAIEGSFTEKNVTFTTKEWKFKKIEVFYHPEDDLNHKTLSPTGRVNLFIGKTAKRIITEHRINLSRTLRELILRIAKENGWYIPRERGQDFTFLARCPNCRNEWLYSALCMATCKYCGKRFKMLIESRPNDRVLKIIRCPCGPNKHLDGSGCPVLLRGGRLWR